MKVTCNTMQANCKLFVTGMLTLMVEGELVNQPLNQTVVFVKQGDIIMSSDTWDVFVQFDLNPYEEVIALLHEELNGICNVTRRSTQFEEVQRIQIALDSLETKLSDLKQFLPKAERKRGLLNAAGSLFKVLFGTATIADLEGLHSTVDALNKNQGGIVHSVNQQATLIK